MNAQLNGYQIGEASTLLGLSVDTLRYYEKIGLLPPISRTPSGIRLYSKQDISRLRFIQRAQVMNFSLGEIAQLLDMREDPQHAREEVRAMTCTKLEEIETQLEEIVSLRDELRRLVGLCQCSEKKCPIIERIDGGN